jgi:hypothetical protein
MQGNELVVTLQFCFAIFSCYQKFIKFWIFDCVF